MGTNQKLPRTPYISQHFNTPPYHINFFVIFLIFFLYQDGCCQTPVKFETVKELEDDWILSSSAAQHHDSPEDFKSVLNPLIDFEKAVWSEASETTAAAVAYIYEDLLEYCDITTVTVDMKYFSDNAVGRIFPCQNSFGDSYCYTDKASSDIEWMSSQYQLNVDVLTENAITIEMNLFPGGFFLFDSIIITHDGKDKQPCTSPSTTTEPTTTGTTTQETTTTIPTTMSSEAESSGGTDWFTSTPMPTTAPPSTTPTPSTSPTTTEGSTETPIEETEEQTTPTTPETSSNPTSPESSPPTSSPTPVDPPATPRITTTTTTRPVSSTSRTTPGAGNPGGPKDDDDGLKLKEILLYIVLPALILLIILIAIISYFCFCRGSGGSKVAPETAKGYSEFSPEDFENGGFQQVDYQVPNPSGGYNDYPPHPSYFSPAEYSAADPSYMSREQYMHPVNSNTYLGENFGNAVSPPQTVLPVTNSATSIPPPLPPFENDHRYLTSSQPERSISSASLIPQTSMFRGEYTRLNDLPRYYRTKQD